MKAVILAAGVASRLRPLTNNTPKCLLDVGNKKILERTIDNILDNGINDIIIVTGFLKDMIEDFVNAKYQSVNFTFLHNDVYASTNNIYSLWMCKDAIAGEDMLLMDSDIVFEAAIIKRLIESDYKDCLALNDHELGDEEMKLIVDSENAITDISKICSIKDAIGESVGIELFSNELLVSLYSELDVMVKEEGLVNVFYELAFERIIKKGTKMYPVNVTDLYSMEIDTVEDYETVSNEVKNTIDA